MGTHDTAGGDAADKAGRGEVIALSDVTLAYGDVIALDAVTLAIREGQRVCILGANGSGKSTLASVMAGLLAPDGGCVRIAGSTVYEPVGGARFDAYEQARREVGLVFQNPDDQMVTSVVEEDVAFGPENLGVEPHEIGVRVRRELRRVAMEHAAKANPSRLSGGQKQRVAIAGALAMEPRVLVLDEPGALLDVRGRRAIMRVMDELHRNGTTIVHVTHFMEEALAAERVIVLTGGRIVLAGTPDEVFAHADELCGLGLEVPFAARLATRLRGMGIDVPFTCEADRLVSALAARATDGTPNASGGSARMPSHGRVVHDDLAADASPSTNAALARSTHSQENGCPSGRGYAETVRSGTPGTPDMDEEVPAVRADGISYRYADAGRPGRRALDGVSFVVGQGSHVAVVGHTGSGKSTLARLLVALAAPDEGTMEVAGVSTTTRRGRRLLHGRVGYVMQHPERQLFGETVWADVAFAPTSLGLSKDEVHERVRRALGLVGLVGWDDASPFALSGGQQRLCAIAGVLAMAPQVLVLDEPTAGLDPRGRALLRDAVDAVLAHGVTVVEVTHSMDDAARCDQVLVLSDGALVADGGPDEVFSAPNAKMLHVCGLGLPTALGIALELEEAGMAALGAPLTMDALANALAQALGRRPSPWAGEGGEHGA